MIHVENDYEPIIYDQPIYSYIYQNHDPFLFNFCKRPTTSNKTKERIEKIEKIEEEITEEKPTECSSTNNIYQNISKNRSYKKNLWTIPLLLEIPKSKQLQRPDLEIDFLIDSGAESNVINIPTWNEIKILHPKLLHYMK